MAAQQPPRMRVVTLASTKGGTGKTTLCAALAVRAAEEAKRVALLDLDPQESLASWWTRRGKTKNPKLIELGATTEAIELLLSEGWQWAFIDTGPAKIDLIEPGIAVADLVLIPVRPSAFDIEQVAICVELCEAHGKPHAFVLNCAQPGTKLTRSSIQFLQQNGGGVIESPITFRQAYMSAVTVGKSGPEVEKSGAGAQGDRRTLGRRQETASRKGRLMSDLEGEDMLILAKFGKRAATASLAGRRARETRPLAAADRRRLAHGSTKSRQINLKVRPEFHERVSALALNEGIAMVELIERAVEAYARSKEG